MKKDPGPTPRLRELPGILRARHGLPEVDWVRLNRLVARRYGHGPAAARAYRALEQDFVVELALALNQKRGSAPYRLVAGRHFDLLSSARHATLRALLEFAETWRKKILSELPGVARDDGFGAHVVLLFAEESKYRRYSARYGSGIGARQEAATVGFYTNDGFGHFAIRHRKINYTKKILAHELVHACLQHLPAPDWLHEGTACMFERGCADGAAGAGRPGRTWPGPATLARLRAFWNATGKRGRAHRTAFWSGRGFYEGGTARADLVRANCFALAEVLVTDLFERRRRDFLRLLSEANHSDGGQSALGRLTPGPDPVGAYLQTGRGFHGEEN